MDMIWAFSFFGCLGFVPTALAAAAIVDIFRVRAEWFWVLIALFIPVLGPVLYFLVYYGPWSSRLGRLSPAAARRGEAKRRLRELEIQLQHWRGPSILAEAGEILLSLNKKKRAEALLREASENGAELKEFALPFATVLQVEGRRWQEALPWLKGLVDLEPDYKFGAARLALARTLDELGEGQAAEEELRAVLVKRNPPEAKVRLARVLMRRHESEEASTLLAEVRADAQGMPTYLRREHKPWIRAAKRLKASTSKLPAPRIDGLPPAQPVWKLAAMVGGAFAIIGFGFYWFLMYVFPFFDMPEEMTELYERSEAVQERIEGLRGEPTDGTDLAEVEITKAQVPGLLELRRILQQACDLPVGESGGGSMYYAEGFMDEFQRQVQVQELLANELELREVMIEDLARHLALVDWRWLGRTHALPLDLPDHFRADYHSAFNILNQPAFPDEVGSNYQQMQDRQKEQARAKIADLRSMAEDRIVLETTRAVFEAHRQELEGSLEEDCFYDLHRLITPDLVSFEDGWLNESLASEPSAE